MVEQAIIVEQAEKTSRPVHTARKAKAGKILIT
jgi:hypothetical protein